MSALVRNPSPGNLEFGEPGDPLVVVIPDWFGRLPWLASYAEALARRGLRVVVLDLYDGVATTDEGQAERLASGLERSAALMMVEDAIERGRDEGSDRVGLIGFALGGGLALLTAQAGDVDAVVAYTATLADTEDGVVPCPVLLHFAGTDEWAPGAEPETFIARLDDDETPVTRHDYPGTTHSFANASLADEVDPQAAGLAFARTAEFLLDYLGD